MLQALIGKTGQFCWILSNVGAGAYYEGRTIYLTHLSPPADGMPYQTVLDTLTRLCPDVIAAVQEYIAAWRARFRQDEWHPTQWGGCGDGVNGAILEVFVTDTRQQVLAACERDAS